MNYNYYPENYYESLLIVIPLGLAFIFYYLCLGNLIVKKIQYCKTSHYVFASNFIMITVFGAWRGGEKDWELLIYLWNVIALCLFSLFFTFFYFPIFYFNWIYLLLNLILLPICIVTLIIVKRSKKNLFPNAIPLNFSYNDVQKKLKNERKKFLNANKKINQKKCAYIIKKIKLWEEDLPNPIQKKLSWKGTDIEWKKYASECLINMIKVLQWSFMRPTKKHIDINVVVRYRLLEVVERYSLKK